METARGLRPVQDQLLNTRGTTTLRRMIIQNQFVNKRRYGTQHYRNLSSVRSWLSDQSRPATGT